MSTKTGKTAAQKGQFMSKATPAKKTRTVVAAQIAKPKRAKSTRSEVVRARIDGKLKREASIVLAAMGLTASEAYRMMMVRIATEKALPFNPLVPNQETMEALEAARRGDVTVVSSISEMFE